MQEIRNLTGRDIVIRFGDWVKEISKEPLVIDDKHKEKAYPGRQASTRNYSLPVTIINIEAEQTLPPRQEGVVLIVSPFAASRHDIVNRGDVLIPADWKWHEGCAAYVVSSLYRIEKEVV